MIEIKIDGKKVKTKKNKNLLQVCLDNGFEIPHFCYHENFECLKNYSKSKDQKSVCRLCLVKLKTNQEIKNQRVCDKIVTSCSIEPKEGMEVITEDEEIIKARKTILELLFADHAGLCAHCPKNLDCELQSLAIKYKIDQFRFSPNVSLLEDDEELEMIYEKMSRRKVDQKNPCIVRDTEKCIKCRRCIIACREAQSVGKYTTAERAHKSIVGTIYNDSLECTYCGQCTSVCPTAALVEKNQIVNFIRAVKDKKKKIVVQTAPSVRVALGEEFEMATGSLVTDKMVEALKKCGADVVFDTNFAADLTIMEESHELIERIHENKKPLPMFTSCCPGWVLFVEQHYPELIEHLSSCRSPQMMMAPLIKYYYSRQENLNPENIFSVSVMPCVAKKYEAIRLEFQRPNFSELDCVLTTRELARLIKLNKIDFKILEGQEFDPCLGLATSAGAIFGSSGGVMEAALRTAYHAITKKEAEKIEFTKVRGTTGIRTAKFKIGALDLRIKVVHGLGNARKVLDEMKKGNIDFDFLEVMACPNGCIGGGGQPVPTSPKIREQRMKAIYSQDETMKLRRSHENPLVKQLYKDFLIQPGSRKAEKFLHTRYYPYEYKLR
jgi:iron-only hydrogenase group A